MPRTIVITGASSGLGAALAIHFAPERPLLALLGRSRERLEDIAARCRKLGAEVSVAAIDVRQRAEIAAWIDRLDGDRPIDLLIANAGVMTGTPPAGGIEPADAGHALIETNVLGVLNTVQPVVAKMMARGRGQVAIVSSVAAFVPLPDAPSYSASKAALLNYGLSLRDLLAPTGVRVNVICPGYIDTPMAARESGPKPFAMSAPEAARSIAEGLERDSAVIAFPKLFALSVRIHTLLPDKLRRWLSGRFRFTVRD